MQLQGLLRFQLMQNGNKSSEKRKRGNVSLHTNIRVDETEYRVEKFRSVVWLTTFTQTYSEHIWKSVGPHYIERKVN